MIKLITDVESESVLKKIKNLLQSNKKASKVESPAMVKRLEESRKQYEEGKAVSIPLSDLAEMSLQSFNDVWDNQQDERWDICLKGKIAHV